MSAMAWGDPIRIFHRKAAKVAQKRQGDRGTVGKPICGAVFHRNFSPRPMAAFAADPMFSDASAPRKSGVPQGSKPAMS
jgi:hypothetical protein